MFLVTGGTGTLGRQVVPMLREAGAEVRILTRQNLSGAGHVTGDLDTGLGIDEALDGVDTVLHLAGSPRNDEQKAAHLVRAAARARKPHIVYVSVVGCERIPVIVITAKTLTDEDRRRLNGQVTRILEKSKTSKEQLLGEVRAALAVTRTTLRS